MSAVIAVLFAAGTLAPAWAADNAELDQWIMESGSEKQVERPSGIRDEQVKDKGAGSPRSVNDAAESIKAQRAGSGQPAGIQPPPAPPPLKTAPAPETVTAVSTSSEGTASSGTLLKGGVTICVPSGTPLKLKLATVPMPDLKTELKDEEGHFAPAQLNQEITARITEDIYVDDNKVIPEGTIFHGKVSKIYAPRHVGRDGHLELSFDSFKMPDGRMFAFRAEANNFKPSTLKSKVKGAGIIAAHMGGGAAVGALVAYKVCGLENTIAMHGYNIAGGAAVGAIGGLAWALWRRGAQAVLEPGDEFAMAIDKDLLIPAATDPTPKAPPVSLPGFELDVISKKTIKDGFNGHMLRLEAMVTNRTHRKLNSIDLFVEDDQGNRYPVSPDIDEDAQEIFYVQPLSCSKIICTFAVEFPKLKHKLVWLDHQSHDVIFEQKL